MDRLAARRYKLFRMTPSGPEVRPALEGFPRAWKQVMTDPRAFFAEMREVGGLSEPFGFLAICAAINAAGEFLLRRVGVGGALRVLLAQVVGELIAAALTVFVAQQLFDGRAGFEPTFRVLCYAAAPVVFAWIPLVGKVASLYAAFLTVRGLERVQGIDTTRAVLTVLVSWIALLVVGAPLVTELVG